MEQYKEKLLSTGVDEKLVNQSLKNKNLITSWIQILDISKIALPCERKYGVLFYELASTLIPQAQPHLEILSRFIVQEKIKR